MTEIIGKFSANFIISAMIPSLAFLTVSSIIFAPVIPDEIRAQIQSMYQLFDNTGLIPTLIVASVVGFILSSLNTSIYKTFEGYLLLHRFPILQHRQQRQARQRQRVIEQKSKEIERIKKRLKRSTRDNERLEERLSKLQKERIILAADYDMRFPRDSARILPTRFGNAFRAAESYPVTRYGIDGVSFWPRLIHVMNGYYEKVDQGNNSLAFILNCSVLSFVMSGLCLLSAIVEVGSAHLRQTGVEKVFTVIPLEKSVPEYQSLGLMYFALVILLLVVSRAFYNAAVPVAVQYGELIRSAYDLFRFQLLEALRLSPPLDSESEYRTWKMLTEFIQVGDQFGELNFKYDFPQKNPTPHSGENKERKEQGAGRGEGIDV